MLRRALTSLFCVLAFIAPAYAQDVFVPRELKALPAHSPKESADKPAKPKEVVRKAEQVADPAPKVATKETDAAKPKVPKTDPVVAKTEKPVIAKEKVKAAPADDLVTIKVEKATTAKDPAASKTVAKVEKEKPAPAKEKADRDLPVIKVEKATVSKESSARTVAKTDSPKVEGAKEKVDKPAASKDKTASESVAKADKSRAKDEPAQKTAAKTESAKVETVTAKTEKPTVMENPATVAVSKSIKNDKSAAKSEVAVAKTEKPASAREAAKPETVAPKTSAKSEKMVTKVEPASPREGPSSPTKFPPVKTELVSMTSPEKEPAQPIPAFSSSLETGFTKLADGFDFPVGRPEAEGYYKARGFRAGGHVGEDWDGVRGGDTDFRDPIFSIGDGIVVFARDVHLGWGNVVIVRHAYREGGNVRYVDALYGHLNTMLVSRGQRVTRGQQIATMGTAHGQYDAHLHFEIRKNLEIGMSRSKFQKDFSNYYDPTQFINSHRQLSGGGANYKVAMNTFTHDWMYHFDKNRNFSGRKRSTSESSAALRKALTSSR